MLRCFTIYLIISLWMNIKNVPFFLSYPSCFREHSHSYVFVELPGYGLSQLRLPKQNTVDRAVSAAMHFSRFRQLGVWGRGAGVVGFWWELSSGGVQRAASPLRPHDLTRRRVRELRSLSRLVRTLTRSWGPTLRASSDPMDLPKAPPPTAVTLGVRAQQVHLGGGDCHIEGCTR